jgi:hypothetical protein
MVEGAEGAVEEKREIKQSLISIKSEYLAKQFKFLK